MAKIVTLTVNPTIDKSTEVYSVASEIKMRCDPPKFHAGGGGINVSRAVHKLGGQSVAVYTSGGAMGDMLTELLTEEGVKSHPISINGLTRENMTVYEQSTTLQYRFGMPGPEMSESEWQDCLDAVIGMDADYIVGSGSLAPGIPNDFYAQLAQRASDSDIKLIIDTSGDALETCTTCGAYLMKPNLRELELLSGREFSREGDLGEIAQDLIQQGMCEVLVVSMGGGGAIMVTADELVRFRPPVVPIRSKVGAGDSMVGGIVWALDNGHSLQDSVRYGIAAGTAAVMTPGTELCRREDTLAIYDQIAVMP